MNFLLSFHASVVQVMKLLKGVAAAEFALVVDIFNACIFSWTLTALDVLL